MLTSCLCADAQSEEVRKQLREEVLALNKRKKEEREKLQAQEKASENNAGSNEDGAEPEQPAELTPPDPLASTRDTIAELSEIDKSSMSRQVC